MYVVRKLEAGDDLKSFQSTNKSLNSWLKRHGPNNQHLYGVTYVAVREDEIVGFVTVMPQDVERSHIGKTGGPSKWPALLIARLATAQAHEGKGVGAALMRKVFELAKDQHERLGCALVTVDSKPESVGFYRKYMFEPMTLLDGGTSNQTAMFLEMGTVLLAMGE